MRPSGLLGRPCTRLATAPSDAVGGRRCQRLSTGSPPHKPSRAVTSLLSVSSYGVPILPNTTENCIVWDSCSHEELMSIWRMDGAKRIRCLAANQTYLSNLNYPSNLSNSDRTGSAHNLPSS